VGACSGAFLEGEETMNLTSQQKKALFWGLGILTVVLLINVAWLQIAASLPHCLSILR
jgi:hypothetical protein